VPKHHAMKTYPLLN